MDQQEATCIARHHLGDTLHRCYRGGPLADVWCVEATYKGAYYPGFALSPEAAAVAVATQLRASGWVPTHARLEWQRDGHKFAVLLRIDGYEKAVVYGEIFSNGTGWADVDGAIVAKSSTPHSALMAAVAAWCAATFPSLHLPPFPEDTQ